MLVFIFSHLIPFMFQSYPFIVPFILKCIVRGKVNSDKHSCNIFNPQIITFIRSILSYFKAIKHLRFFPSDGELLSFSYLIENMTIDFIKKQNIESLITLILHDSTSP